MTTRALTNSTRAPLPGYRAIQAANPDEVLEVTVKLRRKNEISDQQVLDLASKAPAERSYLNYEDIAKTYGADPADLQKLADFAHEHGLAIVAENPAAHEVKLSGSVAAMQRAFGVDLKIYQHATNGHTYRGRIGTVHVPEELYQIVKSVHGLDNREQAVPHFRIAIHTKPSITKKMPARANAAEPSAFTPNQVAALYDFPDATGKGQTIAVIELGGGFRKRDLHHYFQDLGIAAPSVTAVSVQGATNHPTGDPNGDDGEVVLDVEVMGAIARDANIVVYFAQNTDKGFLDAVTAAVHDSQRKPSIISISWGKAEVGWSQQSMDAFNEVFKEAALLGISVLVASGDDGSNDRVGDGENHVDFPASSPFALACGGTRLIAASPTSIQEERCWGGTGDGASGGGISDVFATPDYQQNGIDPPLVRRGVPDVAGDADPATGYQIFVDGVDATVGGTSAVAPLYAALIAQLNEKIGARCGQLHPFLYSNAGVCRDVTEGTNGAFNAGDGWDPATGLGSIKGNELLNRLTATKRKAA